MNSITLPQVQYAGMFKIVKRIGKIITFDSGWQKNLITDGGLNLLGTANNVMAYLHLSSDNTAPSITDNQITNPERVTGGSHTATNYSYTAGQPYFVESVFKYTFAPTTPRRAFNMSKLCLSPSNSTIDQIFSSALVRDSNGNPTTLGVREEETLDVIYAVRQYFDLSVKTSTMVLQVDKGSGIVNEVYDVKVMPYAVGKNPFNGVSTYGTSWGDASPHRISKTQGWVGGNYSSSVPFIAYATPIPSDVTALMAYDYIMGVPNAAQGRHLTPINHTYTEGSLKRQIGMKTYRPWCNFTDGVRAIAIFTTRGVYAVEYTSQTTGKGIPKTSYDELTLNFEISWGRKT